MTPKTLVYVGDVYLPAWVSSDGTITTAVDTVEYLRWEEEEALRRAYQKARDAVYRILVWRPHR